jgi:hypothetical protein
VLAVRVELEADDVIDERVGVSGGGDQQRQRDNY